MNKKLCGGHCPALELSRIALQWTARMDYHYRTESFESECAVVEKGALALGKRHCSQ